MQTRAVGPRRKVVGLLVNAFGWLATGTGCYFLFLTTQSILRIVSLTRQPSTAGLAAPAVAFVGMFEVMFVLVFGFVAVVCLSVGVWIVEPLSLWRRWRSLSLR